MHPWVITTAIGVFPLAAMASPGEHLHAGSVEITPSLDVGAEFRSNVYRSEDDPVPAANLRVAPSLAVVRAGDDHEARVVGQWELRKYLYEGLSSSAPSTATATADRLDRFDEFAVFGAVNAFKQSPFGLRLMNDLRLVNFRADAEYADIPYSSNLRNSLRASARVNPGPALEITPGAGWTYDSYRVPSVNGSDRSLNARNTYGPMVDARWAFLPRTSVLVSSEVMWVAWEENTIGLDPAEPEVALPNSREAKGQLGLDGRLTERVSAQVLLGYGEAVFDETSVTDAEVDASVAQDARGSDGFLFQCQLKYAFTPKSDQGRGNSIAAGYVRDFESSFFTNFVQVNKVFADVQARLGRVEPNVRYEIRFEDYNGGITRTDQVNQATVGVRLRMSDWAALSTGGSWVGRTSSDATVEYRDFNMHAQATVAY